jgi:hypothetical protein
MDMIRKGRVRRAGKGDVVAQVKFISKLFGIAARLSRRFRVSVRQEWHSLKTLSHFHKG